MQCRAGDRLCAQYDAWAEFDRRKVGCSLVVGEKEKNLCVL